MMASYGRFPAHPDLKQGQQKTRTDYLPAPGVPRSGIEEILLPDRQGQHPYLALKQFQKDAITPLAHKNMG